MSLTCDRCNKICKSKSGLTNHLKSCIRNIKKSTKSKSIELPTCFQCKKKYADNGYTYCNNCKLNNLLNKKSSLFDLRTK